MNIKIGFLNWFFYSIVTLPHGQGGKDLIEHVNDNANSQLVERLNSEPTSPEFIYSAWGVIAGSHSKVKLLMAVAYVK